MIACDNEGGCPFEWVRLQPTYYYCYSNNWVYLVPSILCGYEATDAGEVVLLCVQCEQFQEEHSRCYREKGQKEVEVVVMLVYVLFVFPTKSM